MTSPTPQSAKAQPTPRTDAQAFGGPTKSSYAVVYADFARQLERENAELVAALENALRLFNRMEDQEDRVMQKDVDAVTSPIIDLLNRLHPDGYAEKECE